MSWLLALLLLVHGSVHIGYVCSKSWPFASADPWLTTGFGVPGELMQSIGTSLALFSFFAFLLAAGATVGLPPRRTWRWLTGAGAVSSVVMLVAFATPWTLPGLAVDLALLWVTLAEGWTPSRLLRTA